MNVAARPLIAALLLVVASTASFAQDSAGPGYLGVMLDDRPSRLEGVPVMRVHPHTPAVAAGFQVGDIVVSCNGTPVRDVGDFARAIAQVHVGERAAIEVQRGGQLFELTAILSSGADAPWIEPRANIEPEYSPEISTNRLRDGRPMLGLVIAAVHTRSYGLYGSLRQWGVVVEDIVPDSPADRYRVPRGAVLTAINGLPIRSPDDVYVIMDRIPVDRPVELSYVLGGSAYRQLVPLEVAMQPDDPSVELRAPRGVAKPLEEGIVIEPPPEPLPAEVAPVDALPELPPPDPQPEDDVRLPSRGALSPADVRAMRSELDALRRRAAEIQTELEGIKRDAAKPK